MSERSKRLAAFTQFVRNHESIAPRGLLEVGLLLHEHLQSAVADAGTEVGMAVGRGSFDLNVTVDREEYLVEVRKRA